MQKNIQTFSKLIKEFEHRYELRSVFDDFLTMAICSCGSNPNTGKSYDEDLYMETIDKYKSDNLRHNFPKMFSALVLEMEERINDSRGNDVLGEFFEQELSRGRNGQFFTPWPVCVFMSKINNIDFENEEHEIKQLNILDPACGSGRMLLAGAKDFRGHSFFGIDLDHTCVKMTVLNLFLNGVFNGEVMWANALNPDDFRMSYKLSFLPFGIFRIAEKENSPLWNMNRESFNKKPRTDFENAPELPSRLVDKINKEQGGSQLVLL
jgi:type I restriction-modification system DNA methylase subunit